MFLFAAASLLIAQAGLPTVEQDRLQLCLREARTDPATAIVTASTWLGEAYGVGRSLPQQCLGTAYVSLLRWQAAENAFLAARSALLESDHGGRARFAGMAGNAALAEGRYQAALDDFTLAQADAASSGDGALSGGIAADRARALVGLGRTDDAAAALQQAREMAPQNGTAWLLSATLARRQGDLAAAQQHIETAAALMPGSAEVGLEAGVIAALAGDEEAARKSWQSVLATAPRAPEAQAARDYLAQLGTAKEPGR
ncbi:conserved hypothetical protein [Altererythrobacter sp. B11]|uniref:tetratricopeptide repeat protein n=1 Tax=Altererythrobacter sp. B11 TaxID=2060312 RepID=UPI000DC6F55B|nr:tetratricopeptide repeat protein [Altererythrobacter sp. B11]BBC71232.1 conserved hypothetical protein [Altererythrobacter sp. B11]